MESNIYIYISDYFVETQMCSESSNISGKEAYKLKIWTAAYKRLKYRHQHFIPKELTSNAKQ